MSRTNVLRPGSARTDNVCAGTPARGPVEPGRGPTGTGTRFEGGDGGPGASGGPASGGAGRGCECTSGFGRLPEERKGAVTAPGGIPGMGAVGASSRRCGDPGGGGGTAGERRAGEP